MTIEALQSDLRAAAKRAKNQPITDAAEEIRQNIYPLLEGIALHLVDQDQSIAEIADAIDDEGSFIESELGVEILTAFGIAQALVDAVEKLPIADDIAKKAIEHIISDWKRTSGPTAKKVSEAMPEDVVEGDDEDGDDTVPDEGDDE